MVRIIALITWLLLSGTQAFAVCTAPQWALDPLPVASLVQYKTFFSSTLGANTSYGIYLPPEYDLNPSHRFPVLYWLHGGGSNLTSGADFVTLLDDAIARGVTPPFIVVLPNGPETLWTNSNPGKTAYDAPIETVIMNELIPLIDATYRTIATRDGRGIEGFSMGGRGSSRLGLKYPDRFSLVSDLAGAVHTIEFFQNANRAGDIYACVFGSDSVYFEANSPQTHATTNAAYIKTVPFNFRILAGSLDVGNQKANQTFSDFLTGLGIVNTFTTVPGVGHSYQDIYAVQGDSMFTFFADAWEGIGSGDTTAPSTPQGVRAVPLSGSRVTLTWAAATDNGSVVSYKIFRNGTLVSTVPGLSYSDSGLKPRISYAYSVSAGDAAGNESAKSATVRVTTIR